MASFSERELEDWLCEHPEFLDEFDLDYEHVGRQVRLPDGTIMDMLGWDRFYKCPVVVELKAVEADGNALTQLLSYMSAVDNSRPLSERVEETECRGILIAPSFSERVIMAAHWAGLRHIRLKWVSVEWKTAHINPEWIKERLQGDLAQELQECRRRVAAAQPCQCGERHWYGDHWFYERGDGGFVQAVRDQCIICGLRIGGPTREEEEEWLSGLDGDSAAEVVSHEDEVIA